MSVVLQKVEHFDEDRPRLSEYNARGWIYFPVTFEPEADSERPDGVKKNPKFPVGWTQITRSEAGENVAILTGGIKVQSIGSAEGDSKRGLSWEDSGEGMEEKRLNDMILLFL